MLHLQGNSYYRNAKQKLVWGLACGLLAGAAQGQTSNPAHPLSAASPAAAALSADATPTGQEQASKTSTPAANSVLRLGNGDLVEVGVYNVPELSSKARIDSNGNLYLPLVDYVHVAGLTVDEAQQLIEKRLNDGGFVKNPHVSIFVDEFTSQGVSVLGEVVKPGIYPVLGQQRLFDLISAAGGLSTDAGRVVTVTHRNQPDQPVTITLAKNLANASDSNINILPGDTVVVHKADVVYVVGAVNRPSGLLISNGHLTVLQAIALAGGTTAISKLNGTRIIHQEPSGMTETRVPLKKILEAKAPDITMKPNDILFVPNSVFKSAFHDNASIAVQAASLGFVAVR